MSTPTGSPVATSLKDYLLSKADEYGVRDRNARRKEWLEAVGGLLDQIRGWMGEADPEGLLDVIPYQVSRSERGYGTYDAPALQIRFGPAEVTIEPISAEANTSLDVALERNQSATSTARTAGRIDVSNGLRTCHLFRLQRDGGYEWSIRRPDGFVKLDRAEFESVLKELLA
ncbi:hypothetical protein [Paludisphaera rhizosphaerae]|uniref:hypothetical protein n=1 Tax=Paludisphaera rhizosphaerae TaxID=2711216 RepID=UPI0013EC22CA|nr:hypothetical protein [Paludisphaera rhizosphaerae]